MIDPAKIDICFYKKNYEVDWVLNTHNLDGFKKTEFVFKPNEEEFEFLKVEFKKVYSPNVGYSSYKKDIVKNYLFIVADKNRFVYLENAYPSTLSTNENGTMGECSMMFSTNKSGVLDSMEFPFLKPYVRKLKIEKLIKQKII